MQEHTETEKTTRQLTGAELTALLDSLRRKEVNRLWNKEELHEHTGFSIRKIDSLMAEKKIPFIKIGRSVRFRQEAVNAALLKFERKAIA